MEKRLQGTGVTGWTIWGTGIVFLNPVSSRKEYWKEEENSPDWLTGGSQAGAIGGI